MKKFLAIILTFVLCFGVLSVALAAEDEPVADVPDGYIGIYTAEDLDNIRNKLSGKYILMNNINLSSYENWSPIGSEENPFTGELDGNGYAVENMTITAEQQEALNAGLFGYAQNATVKNLTIENGKIDVSADKGVNAGLVCAEAEGSVILNCKTYGSVDAESRGFFCSGGIVGSAVSFESKESFIKCCANFADVNTSATSEFDSYLLVAAGGIAGNSLANIYECSNHGKITTDTKETDDERYYFTFTGGVAGKQYNNLENCYNTGNVTGSNSRDTVVGGIAGIRLAHHNFSYIYNTGEITGISTAEDQTYKTVYCGAIIGMEDTVVYPDEPDEDYERLPFIEINRCYYLDNMEHPASYPESYTEENAKKLTAEEFKNQNSFIGFDFENIWEMDNELGRPVLQNKTKDVIPTSPSTEAVVTTTKNHTDTTTTTVQNDEPSTTTTTQPSTVTTTEMSTEPSTEPNDIGVLAWLIKIIKMIIDWFVNLFVMLGC